MTEEPPTSRTSEGSVDQVTSTQTTAKGTPASKVCLSVNWSVGYTMCYQLILIPQARYKFIFKNIRLVCVNISPILILIFVTSFNDIGIRHWINIIQWMTSLVHI